MAHLLATTDFTSPDVSYFIGGAGADARYLTEADNLHLELLARYGITAAEAPAVLPLPERRVLVLYASMLVCRDRISISHRQAAEGVFEDPWEKLYRVYLNDYNSALSTLSREVLLGGVMNLDGPAGRFYRGGAI